MNEHAREDSAGEALRAPATIVAVAGSARSSHLLRITSGRGRPRLDSTAWVACTFQVLRVRWRAILGVGALALVPAWLLGERAPAGEWALAIKFGAPWIASVIGESALLGLAAGALAGDPSRPGRMLVRSLRRLPVIAAVIALRVLAVAVILALGLVAADRAGEFASLLIVAAVILALGISSAFSQASAVAFSGQCGPIEALRRSSELTHNLRFTVLKAKAKLGVLLLLIGAPISALGEISPMLGQWGESLLEVLWFSTGALLTAVTFLVLSARSRRERIEVTAEAIARRL